ncbi:hypothetical protein D3C84_1302650 [compost metagenome]
MGEQVEALEHHRHLGTNLVDGLRLPIHSFGRDQDVAAVVGLQTVDATQQR